MFWILTIMFIISVAWLAKMMKDLADNGLAEIMMRAFFILITLSLIYYQYVSDRTRGLRFYEASSINNDNLIDYLRSD